MAGKCSLKKGDSFNFLTVVEHHSREKGYLCECVCGNITIVKTYALKTGRVKSCGCKHEYFRKQRVAKTEFASLKNVIYKHAKYQAKRRNYEFKLTKEQYLDLISQNCAYCGEQPKMCYPQYGKGSSETDYSEFKYNGVDRVDNTIGYTKENAVPCCKICNNSKATLNKDEWLGWIKKIYLFNFNSEGAE